MNEMKLNISKVINNSSISMQITLIACSRVQNQSTRTANNHVCFTRTSSKINNSNTVNNDMEIIIFSVELALTSWTLLELRFCSGRPVSSINWSG